MHTLIELKFGTYKGLIKLHLCTNFGWYPIRIYEVMTDFSHKRKSKVCHANKVNYWKELVETSLIYGIIIIGVPFWFERNEEKDHGNMTQKQTGVKIMRPKL